MRKICSDNRDHIYACSRTRSIEPEDVTCRRRGGRSTERRDSRSESVTSVCHQNTRLGLFGSGVVRRYRLGHLASNVLRQSMGGDKTLAEDALSIKAEGEIGPYGQARYIIICRKVLGPLPDQSRRPRERHGLFRSPSSMPRRICRARRSFVPR